MPAILWPVAMLIPAVEISLALLAIRPRGRRAAAYLAIPVHLAIVVGLAMAQPEMARNVAVWPWNMALAFSGLAFFLPWRQAINADFAAQQITLRAVSLQLAFAPIGFYLGIMDAYPAHRLYSAGVARATISCTGSCDSARDVNPTWHALHVPLPPQSRLFRAFFAKTCRAGDVLKITDPHPPFWGGDRMDVLLECPSHALPMAHP